MDRARLAPLRQLKMRASTGYTMAQAGFPKQVNLCSPAVEVMTDFRIVAMLTTREDVKIDEAKKIMMDYGVRSLIVLGNNEKILGIITATDILDNKPVKLAHDQGLLHSEISVRDVMTPVEKMEVISLNDVYSAVVGNVVETLRLCGRQHALVMEQDANGYQVIRGIFSATQIERQLITNTTFNQFSR